MSAPPLPVVGDRSPDIVRLTSDGKFARDLFLLAKVLPTTDSPKLCAMIYDAVVDELGQPGVGYDAVALFHAGQDRWSELHPLLVEAEKHGVAAARDAGWY